MVSPSKVSLLGSLILSSMKDVSRGLEVVSVKREKKLNHDAILHVLSVSPVKDLRDLRHHSRLRSSDTADGPTSSIRNGVHDEWFHFLLAILERLLDDL